MAATPPCCIACLTDFAYVVPALVSATQARRFASPEKADVWLFGFGMDGATEQLLRPVCEAEGIGLKLVGAEVPAESPAMLYRLFMNRFVPEGYSEYLYLDSDVQVTASLDPLVAARVPEGCFLAANDPFTFALADDDALSRDIGAHLASLGLTPEQARRYFNTGVLRIARAGWDELGAEAWTRFRAAGGGSRFPDQDLLNVVGLDRRRALGLEWNFPIFMRNCRVEAEIQPRVYHFMSSPKPWHGAFRPWSREHARPYGELVAKYPQLEAAWPRMAWHMRAAYRVKQRQKQVIETVQWGYGPRRGRILAYEAACQAEAQGW